MTDIERFLVADDHPMVRDALASACVERFGEEVLALLVDAADRVGHRGLVDRDDLPGVWHFSAAERLASAFRFAGDRDAARS